VVDRDAEFRGRVADAVDQAQMGRAGWLWLTRPEGWASELASIEADSAAQAADAAAEREERAATRRLAAAQAAAARAEAEVAGRLVELDAIRGELERERAGRAAAEARVAELEALVADLSAARADVVRNLKDVEARLVDRATEFNAVKARLRALDKTTPAASPSADVPADVASGDAAVSGHVGAPALGAGGVDPAAVGAEVARAARGAAGLAEALTSLSRLLGDQGPTGAPPAADAAAARADGVEPGTTARAGESHRPRARRVPVSLPGGMFDDTVEAAEHLLRTPGAVLVVDGYNVTMEGWPELGVADQRRRLVVALSDLAARTASRVEIVFDGAEVERLSVPAPTRQPVRVRFSEPGVEADDVVIDLVGRIPAATPVIVASSDNRVRDGARRGGANLLHARQLVAVLRR
jgi:predicted RNA-binding protein with PIN domain